jgi:hypothetical protein
MSLFTKGLLAAAAGVALTTGVAQADVIYTFTPTSVTNENTNAPGGPLVATFDLTNSIVSTGSFNLFSTGNNGAIPPIFTGDASDFTSLVFPAESVTPTRIYGSINVSLTFAADGSVTSSNVNFEGENTDYVISGSGSTANGRVLTDDPRCNEGGGCTINAGNWTETDYTPPSTVPEPATFAVLGAGLLGLAAARRRA